MSKMHAKGEHGNGLLRKRQFTSVIAKKKKGKAGSTISVVRGKLYKSSIQKAKETLRIKMMKTGLAKKTEEKRLKAESLMATRRAAEETQAEFELLNMGRNELMNELNTGINYFGRLRAMETLLMLVLGFIGE